MLRTMTAVKRLSCDRLEQDNDSGESPLKHITKEKQFHFGHSYVCQRSQMPVRTDVALPV